MPKNVVIPSTVTIIYANSNTDIFVYLFHSFVILTTCTCNASTVTIIYANSNTDIFVYLFHSFVILTTCTCNESYEAVL